MLINVMLLVSIKACTRILFSLFYVITISYSVHHQLLSEYLKAGNLLKLKNLKETGTVCKLKIFLFIASHIAIAILNSVIAYRTFC